MNTYLRIIALSLLTALVAVVVGCGEKDEPSQSDIIADAESATLKVVIRNAGNSIQGQSGQIIGYGSAWVYDAEQGYIVTNAHVVMNGGTLQAGYSSTQLTKASVVGVDFPNDVAVLQINPAILEGVTDLDLAVPDSAVQGASVIALGYPGNGRPNGLQNPYQATTGTLSAIDNVQVTVPYGFFTNENSGVVQDDLYQTDAAINPGNSGGPLVDAGGNVVGMNYAAGGESQGYAVPAEKLVTIIPTLIEGDSTAWAGLGISAVDTKTAQSFGLNGALEITQVTKDTPADQAGIGQYLAYTGNQDSYLLILAINNQEVGTMEEYINALANVSSGEQVTFTLGIPGVGYENVKIVYP